MKLSSSRRVRLFSPNPRRALRTSNSKSETSFNVRSTSEGIPVRIIIAASVVCTLSTGIIIYGLYKWWVCRKSAQPRRSTELREETQYSVPRGDVISSSEAYTKPNSSPSTRSVGAPPTLQLSPGWPRQNNDLKPEKRSRNSIFLYNFLSEARMESEDGRESPSTIEAIAGSAYPSAAPSRSASTSTRDMTRAWEKLVGAHAYGSGSRALPEVPLASMGEVRRVSSDSRWSWSNRATFQMDEDVESLPAYSVRRSRSLASVGAQTLASRSPSLRSRSRSRRSSTGRPDSRIHSGGPGGSRSRPSSRNAIAELSPSSLEFPIELARKIAQTYPRTPPPPEYYGT